MSWSLPYSLLIAGLLALPSLVGRAIHHQTGDPLWQWLALDEARLAEAETEFQSDGPHVQIRVVWRGADNDYAAPLDLVADLRGAFEAKGITAFVSVSAPPAAEPSRDTTARTTVTMRAGTQSFGPFPIEEVARHVQPAVFAARMAYVPQATEEHRW